MIRLIYDWQKKRYHCAICGTRKSVRYWVISNDNDSCFPVCNKCALLVSSDCKGE